MNARWLATMVFLGGCAGSWSQDVILHRELQAVTATGTTAYAGAAAFRLRGIVLNDPEEMLDPAWNPNAVATTNIGGQYQIFIQSVASNDWGGTALWMGQNYQARGMLGEYYDAAAWSNELARVTVATNGRAFRKGDLIEVLARNSASYGGKRNVNEAHVTDPDFDFEVSLVQANVGLPRATPLTLADLVATGTNQIFDADRRIGGERWQGERVRLDGIRLTTTNGWGQTDWRQRLCWAADAAGRGFPLRMPLKDLGAPLSTAAWFSAVGILNQETLGPVGTNGYELFVQELQPEPELGRTAAGAAAVSFPADYEGYVVEYSDDGMGSWQELDATPRMTIVVEDPGAPTSRFYRLKWMP